MNTRECLNSPVTPQSIRETRVYPVDWPTTVTPASPVCRAFLAGSDVSGAVLSGAATVSGQRVTTSLFAPTVPNVEYTIEVQVTSGGQTIIRYFRVWTEA